MMHDGYLRPLTLAGDSPLPRQEHFLTLAGDPLPHFRQEHFLTLAGDPPMLVYSIPHNEQTQAVTRENDISGGR